MDESRIFLPVCQHTAGRGISANWSRLEFLRVEAPGAVLDSNAAINGALAWRAAMVVKSDSAAIALTALDAVTARARANRCPRVMAGNDGAARFTHPSQRGACSHHRWTRRCDGGPLRPVFW